MKTFIVASLIATSAFAGTIQHPDCRVVVETSGLTEVSEQNLMASLAAKGYQVVDQNSGATLRLGVMVDTSIQEMQERQLEEEQVIPGMGPSFWERRGRDMRNFSRQTQDALVKFRISIENRFYGINFVLSDSTQLVTVKRRSYTFTHARILAQNSSMFMTEANAQDDEFVARRLSHIPSCKIK
jgi:hypothetical protein